MKHILLFGDSLFARMGKTHIEIMEKDLSNYSFHNIAIGGINSRDAIKQANFFKTLTPEIICISLGTNDCNPYASNPIPLVEFRENIEEIVSLFSNSMIIFFPLPPVFDAQEIIESENFNILLETYNEVLYKLSKENKRIAIISSKEIFGNLLKDNKNYHESDGLHLNTFGYEILCEEIVRIIKKFSTKSN
jgi:lysophospholipase L1-like esterase